MIGAAIESAREIGGEIVETDPLERVYGCPVEIMGHGIPHTLLASHGEEEKRP